MLNFLPQKNKNQIIFEYFLRIVVFSLIFIFIASLTLILLFMPSFFFVKYKNETINIQLESVKQKNVDKGGDPISFIKKTNKLSTVLSDDVNLAMTDIVNKVISLKNKNIKILSISISSNIANGETILINGIANNRDSLTLYKEDIENDGFFEKVVFPVSNFIKNSNSEFSATLTI